MSDFKYDVLVKQLDGVYFVICEPLNIFTENPDLNVAYAELKSIYAKMIERAARLGLTLPVHAPKSTQGILTNNVASSCSKPSCLKVASFILLIGLLGIGVFGANTLFQRLQQPLTAITNMTRNVKSLISPTAITASIAKVAETLKAVTPQKKAEIHKDLETIVNEIEPFVDEIRPLFSDQSANKH